MYYRRERKNRATCIASRRHNPVVPDHGPDAASALGDPTEPTDGRMDLKVEEAWPAFCHDCDRDEDRVSTYYYEHVRPALDNPDTSGPRETTRPTTDAEDEDEPAGDEATLAYDHQEPEIATKTVVGRRVSTPRAPSVHETCAERRVRGGAGPSPRPTGVPSESTECLTVGLDGSFDPNSKVF